MGIKLTVRSRPNFGHCTETNTVIAAAAAFRRPSPLSEWRQLGGKQTSPSITCRRAIGGVAAVDALDTNHLACLNGTSSAQRLTGIFNK